VTNPRVPRPAPGIPNAALPPRAKQITLPGVPRPSLSELDAVTEIQRQPSRQDARSEATDTPIGPLGQRRERLPERQAPRSLSPAPFERPENIPAIRREVERRGDRLEPAPESIAPAPSVTTPSREAVHVRVGDVDVRVGASVARRVLPWLVPVLLSVAGTAIGYLKGYVEGLAAAGRRVAAVEEAVRLNAEGDARHETKTTLELNRAFVVLDDHDERLPKVERRVGKLEEAQPKIQGLPK
jgi:hypothetical protein